MKPSPNHPATHVLLAALLILSGASAAGPGPVLGELTSPELQVDGPSTTTAGLVVLLQENTLPEHAPGNPAFQLEAEHLRIETDHADIQLGAGLGIRSDPSTTTQDHFHATVTGLVHRDNYQFSVWPTAVTTFHAEDSRCTTVASTASSTITRASLVDARRTANTTTIGDALAWQTCQASHVTVRGDFLLRLWEWDAELQVPGSEAVHLESGKRALDGSPSGATGDTSFVAGQATEQFLYAANATLTIPVLKGTPVIVVRDALVEAKQVRFPAASGNLLGHAVERQPVLVRGDLELYATSQDAGLATHVTGNVERVELDGQTIPVATVFAGPGSMSLWSVVAVMASLLLVGVAWRYGSLPVYHRHRHRGADLGSVPARTRRQRRAVGHWLQAKRLNKRGLHKWSHRKARAAVRLFPGHPESALMLGIAQAHTRKDVQATLTLQAVYDCFQDPCKRAVTALALAASLCRLHDTGRAKDRIEDAVLLDPEYVLPRLSGRVFDVLEDDSWFRALRAVDPAKFRTHRGSVYDPATS